MCAFVSSFRPVIEAESALAGFAAEREEIELVAVRELAMFAYGFKITIKVHLRK